MAMDPLRLGALAVLPLAALLLAGGCYEIPPSLEQPVTPAARRVPPAVYALEPFDPLNRWYGRLFAHRDGEGNVLAAAPDEPLPPVVELAPVDCAELLALTGAARTGRIEGAAAFWTFRADALAAACRLAAGAPPGETPPPLRLQLAAAVLEIAARRPDVPPPEPASESWTDVLPPPWRDVPWSEVEAPAAPPFLPAASDLRWTVRLAAPEPGTAGGVPRTALLRLRIALDGEGSPVLLPLASECLLIEEAGGASPALRYLRFDRARALVGMEPWREGEAPESLREAALLLPPAPAPAPAPGAHRGTQLERARAAFGGVVDSLPQSR